MSVACSPALSVGQSRPVLSRMKRARSWFENDNDDDADDADDDDSDSDVKLHLLRERLDHVDEADETTHGLPGSLDFPSRAAFHFLFCFVFWSSTSLFKK